MPTIQQLMMSMGATAFPPPDPSGPSPADISGLQLWLKANNMQFAAFTDGQQISGTWDDSSANSRNATAVQAGTTPTYPKLMRTSGPNSYPAIRMVTTGAGSLGGWFTLPDFLTGFTAGDYFAVVQLDASPSTNNGATPLGDWCSGTDDSYYTFTGDGKIYDQWGTTARKDAITVSGLNSWHLYEVRNAALAWSNYKNGAQLFTTAINTVGWGTAPKVARVTGSSKFMLGMVAELIFYNSVLSSSDRFNTIHTYLNNKYAFSLPTS